jgi:CxxC-x17-CxxC domain-containing protein
MAFMGDFNRNYRSGGGRDFKRRDFDKPRSMFKATCSNCGRDCEVPFKPNGSKPVFCRECFQSNKSSNPMSPDNFTRHTDQPQQSQQPQHPQYKEQFEILNTKLDKILNLLAIKEAVIQTPVIDVIPAVVKSRKVSKKVS